MPLKNIEAVQELTALIASNLGPNGRSKLVVTHLDKVIVTRRTETVLFNLTVEHPMAKLVVMAAKNLAGEVGDGTTQIVAWIGELLGRIKPLIVQKLPVKDIQDGLDLSLQQSLQYLDQLVIEEVTDVRNVDQVVRVLKPVIGAKMSGQEDFLANLVAKACISICPKDPRRFNVDNVRFAKVMGGIASDSQPVKGFCLARDVEGSVKHLKNAKIAVFGCAIDRNEGETKGTIVLEDAKQLENYTQKEEGRMKAVVEDICSTGATVVVTGSTVSEIALHYLEKKGVMVVKILSKFDLRRFCLATRATALVRLGAPTPEELGFCKSIDVKEVGGMNVLIISQHDENEPSTSSSSSAAETDEEINSRIATLLLRSSTQAALDDLERVLIDAVNTYRDICRDPRLVAGGGAFEMELAKKVREYGKSNESLAQYTVEAFADSLGCVPRLLAETSGLDPNEIITQLAHNHAEGKATDGVDARLLKICDVVKESGLVDTRAMKEWVLRFGVDTVKEILSVDTIIMAKPAGLKPPGEKTIGAADQD